MVPAMDSTEGNAAERAGDPKGGEPRDEALQRLVDAHAGRLFSLGMHFCGNREEAQDLVQETFLQAFRNWDQFEGRSKASTWLYTIASRVCQRFHRKRSGEPEHIGSLEELVPLGEAEMAVVSPAGEPLAAEMRAEARREVEQAIAELPIEFRMPLVLKEVVGFSIAEVAEILGLKKATVKTRLHRARLRIRKAIEAPLPKRSVPPAIYSRQVCLDLLQAKQEALDRGTTFRFPDDVICERCSELFATLDLATDLCGEIAGGEIPEEVRAALLSGLKGGRDEDA